VAKIVWKKKAPTLKADNGLPLGLPLQLTPRLTFKDGHLASLKHTFTDIKKWGEELDIQCRLFSPKLYVNGYEWYIFLQHKAYTNPSAMEVDNPDLLDYYQPAVYLRCHSRFMPVRHYLPISMTISVALKPSSERKFKNQYVIFENSTQAIGGPLTDDNWKKILEDPLKQGGILINDSITVTIGLEFLDNADNCIVFT